MKISTVSELSELLKKSTSSIYSDSIRNPSVLPPILRIPGSRKLLFVNVEEWMNKFVVVHQEQQEYRSQTEARHKSGAPTKRERLAKQGVSK